MAPEQALDKGADYRADIYGLGATLFNLVTGEKPYVAATPVAVMNMHLKAPVPDASEVNRNVSKGLAQVITKMLAKRPADRYQDPERLIHDLTTVLQGFMPDLKGGETPVGLDFIAPRNEGGGSSGQRRGKRSGSGSAPQRSGYARRGRQHDDEDYYDDDDEPQKNWLPIAIAAAAGILIGVVVFLNSGNEPKKVVVPDEPEVAEVDPLVEAEKRAAAALEAITSEDWQRIEDLEALAKEFKQTPSGKKARTQARDLRTTLTRSEEQRYDEGDRRLTELAMTGRLRAAVDGYTDLNTDLHVEGLKRRAKQRADELLGLLKERSAAAEAQAKKLENEGNEREAAEIRRKRAKELLSDDEAKAEETRAAALEKKADDRERAVAEARQRELDLERQREEAKVAALPTNLVTLVKEDELEAALSMATETASAITSAPLKERAKVHVQALEAIRGLQPLALRALEKRPGATVSFKKKKGGKISGSLASVTDDTITVKVLRGALLSVTLNDLVENVTWTWARRAEGKTGAAYLRGVTSLKLYRSDDDALKYLAQCQEAGVDLSALVAELRRVEPSGQPVTGGGGGGEETTDPKPASTDRPKTPAEIRAEAEAKRKKAELLIAQRKNLFREADDVGYEGASGRVEPIYEFHQDGRKFRKDWRVVRGTASPTPPGNIERQGLRLLGNDGRAEFVAPLQNDLDIIIRFLSWGNDKRGRLVIALEGEKGRRVLCNIGAIDFRVKRKLKLRRGESKLSTFRNRADIKFEVIRQGRFIVTKINTDETAKVELPEDEDLGKYRLVLEWGRVSISLIRIRMLCQPTDEWIEKRLKQK